MISSYLNTPLGPMLAVGDENALYLLEFVGRRGLKEEIEHLQRKTRSVITPGYTRSIASIKEEIESYFAGTLKTFSTSKICLGSPFQKQVWKELEKIPFGETRSYSGMAISIGRPKACRAVARANATNSFAIIIPCHRVIHANGSIGGYAAGVMHKQWLLNHERLT